MVKIELVKRVKYAGDIHEKLAELGWDSETAALFCDDLPDADVAPVRHARWEVDESGFLECTNCAWVRHGIPLVEHYPYCPNCGARMDLGGDGNA